MAGAILLAIFLLMVQAHDTKESQVSPLNVNEEKVKSELQPFLNTMENEKQVFGDLKNGLKELDQLGQKVELSPTEMNNFMDIRTSADTMANEILRKTDVTLDKLNRLKETDMFIECASYGKCGRVMPALNDVNNHLESRAASFRGLKISIEDFEMVFSNKGTHFGKEIKEIAIKVYPYVKGNYEILKNIIVDQVLSLLNDVKLFNTLLITEKKSGIDVTFDILLSILLVYALVSGRREILSALLFLAVALFCLAVLLSIIQKFTNPMADVEEVIANKIAYMKNADIIQNLQTNKLFKYFTLQKVKDGMGFALKKIKNGQKTTTDDSENLLFLGQHIKTKLRELVVVGGQEYNGLRLDAEEAYEDFKEYVKKVLDTLTKSKRVYQKIVINLESLVESNEVSMLDIRRFIKETLVEIENMETEYDDNKKNFAQLQNRLNGIQYDISKFEEQNKRYQWNSKLLTGTVWLAAAFLFPPAASVFTGLTATGTVIWVHNKAEEKNVVLRDVRDINEDVKERSLKQMEILSKIDPSLIRSSMDAAAESLDGEKVEKNDLIYYFGEALEMAKMSLKETKDAVESMKILYRYKG